ALPIFPPVWQECIGWIPRNLDCFACTRYHYFNGHFDVNCDDHHYFDRHADCHHNHYENRDDGQWRYSGVTLPIACRINNHSFAGCIISRCQASPGPDVKVWITIISTVLPWSPAFTRLQRNG